jgi:type IX secretion system PorP/SprF family membrane protein
MKKLFLLSLLYFVLHSLNAQDQLISVFSSSTLNINPATTGTFGNSNLRVFSGFDWNTYSGLFSEKTINLSADKTIMKGKVGVGGNLSYEFGDDIIKSKGALLSTAYNRGFLKDNYTFSVGIQGGIMQKSIDWDRLYFSDQLSPYSGGVIYDTLGSAKEQILYSDFNLGALVFRNSDKSKILPWIGFSVSHLFQPNVSFLSLSSPLARKLTIHAGVDIPVNENIIVTPLLLYSNQDYFKVLDLGCTTKYQKGSFSASLGGIYKNILYDIFINQQISLLGELGFAGFEIRMEMMVIELNDLKRLDYSRGMIGLSWNLQKGKN